MLLSQHLLLTRQKKQISARWIGNPYWHHSDFPKIFVKLIWICYALSKQTFSFIKWSYRSPQIVLTTELRTINMPWVCHIWTLPHQISFTFVLIPIITWWTSNVHGNPPRPPSIPLLFSIYAPILSPCFLAHFLLYYFPTFLYFLHCPRAFTLPFSSQSPLPAAGVLDQSRCVATPTPKALYKLLYFRAIAASRLLKPRLLSCDSIVKLSVFQRRRATTIFPSPPALCIR